MRLRDRRRAWFLTLAPHVRIWAPLSRSTGHYGGCAGAPIHGGSGGSIWIALAAALLGGFLQRGLQIGGVPNQISAHCPVRFSLLLLSLVVPVSLHRHQILVNGTHAVAMRIRHDFLLKFMEREKNGQVQH